MTARERTNNKSKQSDQFFESIDNFIDRDADKSGARLKKSGTQKSGLRTRPGGQRDFHQEYRKSLKSKRGASIKEVAEENPDLEQGARGKKISPSKKGPITSVTINKLHYGVSSTLPAPGLEA
mgnify:CR=1 FL=1